MWCSSLPCAHVLLIIVYLTSFVCCRVAEMKCLATVVPMEVQWHQVSLTFVFKLLHLSLDICFAVKCGIYNEI